MTISPELRHAYNFHRRIASPARNAIFAARADVENGKARFNSSPWEKRYAPVSWQAPEKVGNLPFPEYSKRGLAHVTDPASIGLRHVGNVEAETRRNDIWARRDTCGWHTDPYGDVFKDGTGLCWGVVYQLAGRNGKARFVAGYQFGGTDAGPTVDFGRIYESSEGDGWTNARDFDAARDAAYAADSMAQSAAEDEREYQTAWQAGSQYASAMEERAEVKAELRALLVERRAAKGELAKQGIGIGVKGGALCAAIERRARDMLDALEDLAGKARKLAEGEGGEYLSFWPGDERLKAAFNEGAGAEILS